MEVKQQQQKKWRKISSWFFFGCCIIEAFVSQGRDPPRDGVNWLKKEKNGKMFDILLLLFLIQSFIRDSFSRLLFFLWEIGPSGRMRRRRWRRADAWWHVTLTQDETILRPSVMASTALPRRHYYPAQPRNVAYRLDGLSTQKCARLEDDFPFGSDRLRKFGSRCRSCASLSLSFFLLRKNYKKSTEIHQW